METTHITITTNNPQEVMMMLKSHFRPGDSIVKVGTDSETLIGVNEQGRYVIEIKKEH